MEELIQGERGRGRRKGGATFSEFLTPEKAAISAEGRGRWGALTLHHFRPFLLSQGGDRVTRGRGRGSGDTSSGAVWSENNHN